MFSENLTEFPVKYIKMLGLVLKENSNHGILEAKGRPKLCTTGTCVRQKANEKPNKNLCNTSAYKHLFCQKIMTSFISLLVALELQLALTSAFIVAFPNVTSKDFFVYHLGACKKPVHERSHVFQFG